MSSRIPLLSVVMVALLFSFACGGGSVGGTKTTTTYTIGGTLSGLASGATVVLSDNTSDSLSLTANGAFTFKTAVNAGSAYSVTVATQPSGQTCTVTGGSGTANANVTGVSVTCGAPGFTIGGTLSWSDERYGRVAGQCHRQSVAECERNIYVRHSSRCGRRLCCDGVDAAGRTGLHGH